MMRKQNREPDDQVESGSCEDALLVTLVVNLLFTLSHAVLTVKYPHSRKPTS